MTLISEDSTRGRVATVILYSIMAAFVVYMYLHRVYERSRR